MSSIADEFQSIAEIERLEAAIAALEAQREELGDAVVDTTLPLLRSQLATLKESDAVSGRQWKFVTVLFVDMTDSTGMSDRLDLEQIMTLTDDAMRRFGRIVERRGGRVIKYMGDGLLAAFGLAQIQEDDAERAVQAGLDILRAAKLHAQVLEETLGLSGFNIRLGANTGEILSGGGVEEDRTAMGMTINLASRMEKYAPPGALRITHATFEHIRGMFKVDAQPPLKVKGQDKPMRTYLVLGARPRALRVKRHGISGIETPFVGRQAEFDQLQALYKRTLHDRWANMVTIVGEPGVGKSRLLVEFERQLARDPELAHSFNGRGFRPRQDSPYSVLRLMVANFCRINDSDGMAVVYSKLESRLAGFFEEEPLLKTHVIGALLGYNFEKSPYMKGIADEPDRLRERGLHYLDQMFIRATSGGLTLILVEDIQWADLPTLKFLKKLVTSCAGKPLFIVSLARPEITARLPGFLPVTEDDRKHHTRLDLAPLSRAAGQQLVTQILHNIDRLPTKLVDSIVDQAEGNPFYIEELVKVLIDDGVILRPEDDGGAWEVDTSKLAQIRIPDTLTAVILSRLNHLRPSERLALTYASVAGRSFWGSLVDACSDRAYSHDDILSSLADRDLIYTKEDSTFSNEKEYAFKHALLREAIYETILTSKRQLYHGRVADWLLETTRAGGRENEFATVIAEHYDRAGKGDRAADFYLLAGELAMNQGVPGEALRSLNRSLELMAEERSSRRWQAMLYKASVLDWLGNFQEQLLSSRALVEYAAQTGVDDQVAEAHRRLGYALRLQGQFQEEASAYRTAINAAKRAGDIGIQARANALLAHCLLRLGQAKKAQASAEQAFLLAAGISDDGIRAQALTNVAGYYSDAGDVARATRLFAEVVELCSAAGMNIGESANRINLGYNYTLLGLPDLAIEILEEAIRLTTDIGANHFRAISQLNLGLALVRSGEYGRAKDLLVQAQNALQEFGEQFNLASSHLYLGLCQEQNGEREGAITCFERAAELFEEIQTPGYIIDAKSGIARMSLLVGDIRRAQNTVRSISGYLAENGSQAIEFPGLAYLTCAQVYEAVGQHDKLKSVITAGYSDLITRAEKIDDVNWRHSFLANINEHRALIEREKSLA